jgi:hypothetical protein
MVVVADIWCAVEEQRRWAAELRSEARRLCRQSAELRARAYDELRRFSETFTATGSVDDRPEPVA